MEFIKTIREKHRASQQNCINEQAHNSICLDDFDDKIFISYNGTPLIPIEESWTQKEILAKLTQIRNSYTAFKMAQANMPMATAAL